MLLLNRIRPELFFLIAGLVLGLTLLFITPPFQAPDEINHFYRAWQISEGQLTGIKTDNRVGGTVPESIDGITPPFRKLRSLITNKITKDEILAAAEVPLNADSSRFCDFPNTALYSPVSYAPQAIGIFVLRKCACRPLYILYATRLITLLVWLVTIWFSLRMLPGFRWLFALLALLPMSVFSNMAMSADMMTNAVAFLTIAYILRCAYSEGPFLRKHFLVLLLLAFLLASAKIVYLPLLLLVFLIPREKFPSQKMRLLQSGAVLLFAFIVGALWSSVIGSLYTPYADYNPLYRDGLDLMPGAHAGEQINYILSHDTFVLRVILRSLKESAEMYVPGYIGTFGWLDVRLPGWFIALSYAVLIFTAVAGDKDAIRFSGKQRAMILGILFLLVSIVIVSQLLSWEAVGNGRVFTLQGRYFIPVFPLLFMFAASFRVRHLKMTAVVVMVFVLLSGCMTVNALYRRYYVDPIDHSMTIRCGGEAMYGYDYYATDQRNVYLDNATYTRGTSHVRNGSYAFSLNAANPYAAGCRFSTIEAGDSVYAEVWRYGEAGNLILSDDTSAVFGEVERRSDGWQKITLEHKFESGTSGKATLFLWSANESSADFDDLEIRFCKAATVPH